MKISQHLVAALDLLLLDKDNLPSYNRIFTSHMHLREGWHRWIGIWTAEEGAHAIALRDYLVVTGATDPVLLEKRRLGHVSQGVEYEGRTPLQTLIFAALHEWVTRDFVHAVTTAASAEPVLAQLLGKIAEDEERHADFFSKVIRRGLEVAPDHMVIAFAAHFEEMRGAILGSDIADYEENLESLATAGVHSADTEKESIVSALTQWGIWEINSGLSEAGNEAFLALQEYARK